MRAPQRVRDRNGFAHFLRELADDRIENPESWENAELVSFFHAWAAWLDDCDGYLARSGDALPDAAAWQFIATMLLAARIYE